MNEYTDITEYYDLFVQSGYYDYREFAEGFHAALGDRRKVLEVGTGTGLLLEQLLDIDPSYDLTGTDHTESMLKVARDRLGDRAKLIVANLVSMDLGETFDAVISNGVWGMMDEGDEYHFGTHLPDEKDNLNALQNVAKHLDPGGLFLINIQGTHNNYGFDLGDGITYRQEVAVKEETLDRYFIHKTYIFEKEGHILTKQECTYKIFRQPAIDQIMTEAGFKFRSIHESKKLHCYSKV